MQELDLPLGLGPAGKSDQPREFPRANFSSQPLWTFHCLYHILSYANGEFSENMQPVLSQCGPQQFSTNVAHHNCQHMGQTRQEVKRPKKWFFFLDFSLIS